MTSGNASKALSPLTSTSSTGSTRSDSTSAIRLAASHRGRCDAATVPDLRGFERQTPDVKGLAKWERHGLAAVPAQFDDRPLERGQPQGQVEPHRRAAGVNDGVGAVRCFGRRGEADAQRRGDPGARGIDVDELDVERGAAGEPGNQAADHAAANHRDAIAEMRSGVPQTVHGGLEICSQHGAGGRDAVRQDVGCARGHDVPGLMRVQDEDGAALEAGRSALDTADARIAVLHRPWELAGLERRAHSLVLARRYAAGEDQGFRPAADAAIERADLDLVGRRLTDALQTNLATAGSHHPECPRPVCHRANSEPLRHTLQSHSLADTAWRPARVSLHVSAVTAVMTALAALVVVGLYLRAELTLGTAYPLKAATLFAAIMLLALGHLDGHHPFERFGAANQVTTVRAALVVLVTALIGERSGAAIAGSAAVISTAAVLLDGTDGWLARRSGTASPFGARFDMETDALLIQVLAILAWQHGKAGAWVLASGLMRYVFVAAGWRWEWLTQPLFPSRRRKAICVAQTVGLILAITPAVPAPESGAVAAVALAALAYSFLVDTAWLWQRAAGSCHNRPKWSRSIGPGGAGSA